MKNFDRMKTIINVTIMLFLSVLLCSCNPQACLQRRTDRIIKRSYNQVDTVFVYSIAFHNYKVAWFHKGNLLHLFRIKPHSTKHYKPIEAKNITFNSKDLDKYFEDSIFKDVKCFELTLDGEWVEIFIKNQKSFESSIDISCLYRTKYKPNSLPYKLQYDFYKIRILPINFNFDFWKKYFEE